MSPQDFDFTVAKAASGVTVDRVSCELSSRHNRRVHPDASVEDEIDRVWRKRLDANPCIFNGCKFRLKAMLPRRGSSIVIESNGGSQGDRSVGGCSGAFAATASTSQKEHPSLAIELGLTDYRSYLGTNASDSADRLIRDGLDIHEDREAFLSMKLGVGSVTLTADGFLVFILRSSHVAEAQGMVDVPGGHPEPENIGLPDIGSLSRREARGISSSDDDKFCKRAVAEIFDSAVDEVVAETNAPRKSLRGQYQCTDGNDGGTGAVLLGIVNQLPTAGAPSFAFGIRCSLTRAELEARYELGAEEAEESVRLIFASESSLIERLKRTSAVDAAIEDCAFATLSFERDELAPMRFTPSTRGCLTLWLAHTIGVGG